MRRIYVRRTRDKSVVVEIVVMQFTEKVVFRKELNTQQGCLPYEEAL